MNTRLEFLMVAMSAIFGFAGGCGAAAGKLIQKPRHDWVRYMLSYGAHGLLVGAAFPLVLEILNVPITPIHIAGGSAMMAATGAVGSLIINAIVKAWLKARGFDLVAAEDEEREQSRRSRR